MPCSLCSSRLRETSGNPDLVEVTSLLNDLRNSAIRSLLDCAQPGSRGT